MLFCEENENFKIFHTRISIYEALMLFYQEKKFKFSKFEF